MTQLSPEEILFLERMEQQRIKHNQTQKKYRANKAEQIREYNKKYYEARKQRLNSIKSKIRKIPININVEEIILQPKIDKRTKKGKLQAKTNEIIPRYENRAEPLSNTTIDNYMSKANVINNIFNKRNLSAEVKAELKKLFNDSNNINENVILNEMNYINNNIENTIDILRKHYNNDNTFKGYIIVLTNIASHLKSINKNIHQKLSKVGIYTNKKVQEKREKNELDEGDYDKIINLNEDVVMRNIPKLKKIDDVLIYLLYTLQPARRLDYRNVKITTETNIEKLKDPSTNYLIVGEKPYIFIFNDYKTDTTYGQQKIAVENHFLNLAIDEYINDKKLREGDYLFSLIRDKREIMSEPVFSQKISNIFYKVYGVPVSVRFIRMSWATYFYSTERRANEIREFAYKMAHSIEENIRYKKLIRQK